MILEGDMAVIDAIKEKKCLMDRGEEHGHIRPMLIIDGGFMKGVYGVGAAVALEELGLVSVFTNCVGISSGAVTLAYTLSGQAIFGSTIISEECCSREFLSFRRWKNPEDTLYFQTVLEGSTGKKLETANIIDSNFYLGLSEFETAKPFLLHPQTASEVNIGIRASISMPGAVSDEIYIRNKQYVDGAFTQPHILEHACEQIDATHILIITNQDTNTKNILWWDSLLTRIIGKFRMSKKLYEVALKRRSIRYAWTQKALREKDTPLCLVWGNGSIASFERDGSIAKQVVEKSRLWWHELLK